MRRLWLILYIILFTACSSAPSSTAVQTAVAQTQAALPTSTPIPTPTAIPTPTTIPTPTLIPLSDINIEGILLLAGDLPTDFVGQQIKNSPPNKFQSIPSASQIIRQEFRAGIYASDGITIFLYDSLSDLDNVYNSVTGILSKEGTLKTLSDVGEKAVIHEERNSLFLVTSVQVVFLRCHALVYIDLLATTANSDIATTYAQRIDKRLYPLICR